MSSLLSTLADLPRLVIDHNMYTFHISTVPSQKVAISPVEIYAQRWKHTSGMHTSREMSQQLEWTMDAHN